MYKWKKIYDKDQKNLVRRGENAKKYGWSFGRIYWSAKKNCFYLPMCRESK